MKASDGFFCAISFKKALVISVMAFLSIYLWKFLNLPSGAVTNLFFLVFPFFALKTPPSWLDTSTLFRRSVAPYFASSSPFSLSSYYSSAC